MADKKDNKFILWFNELGIDDVGIVGGKNASLGEMYRELTKKGVNIPNGFAITAHSYKYLLESSGAEDEIKKVLSDLNTHNLTNLQERGRKVRDIISGIEFPKDLYESIKEAYEKLEKEYGKDVDVAVRSSATAEDLPTASFAGQQETYLNIRGMKNLVESCKKCFASLFTNRAISYRADKGFDHFKVYLSIGVQKMVRSDLASSGVMFSVDTESGFKESVSVTSIYGLGENIVQGAVNPDEFHVFKPTLKIGFKPIIKKSLGDKKIKMIYSHDGNKPTKNVVVSEDERKKFSISDEEVLTLAKWGVIIEDHYTMKRKKYTPMDMEWAKDGKTNKLFIVQARPETVTSQKKMDVLETYKLKKKSKVIVQGQSVGAKIGSGSANVIKDVKDIHKFNKGEVLVTDMTDPDWEPIMKIASAIVTNRGGRTCFDGKTKVLTNYGFKTLKEIYDYGYQGLLTLSLNKKTKKMEWKKITDAMVKKSPRIRISVSQSGKINDNTLILTPDHKMVGINNAQIEDKQIKDIICDNEMLCIAQKIPAMQIDSQKDKKLAYLLGGIMTDGSIYRTRTHGEVAFIQKQTPEKEAFIDYMQSCMTSVYNKSFVPFQKNISSGFIRGKEVKGQATAFRLYSKQIAYDMNEQEQKIVTTLLQGSEDLSYNFLAGVIDGDGSFYNNRIQIYVSENRLLEGVVVACLKLGIVPQITRNRNIYNVQIVEKLKELLSYTKRVKGEVKDRVIDTRFFSAKQLFGEEVKGQLKLRRDNNLYISARELEKFNDKNLNELLEGDIRMQRVKINGECDYDDVYNITVEDNHTYVVFSEKLSPIIVNNCHAAIISRELGIPCVVGTNKATSEIKSGNKITVSCAEGEEGYVYDGILPFDIEKIDISNLPKTKTKIMMNVGNPDEAFSLSFIPNDGVGLAREEFIINSYIRIHPKALINFDKLSDHEVKKQIEELTSGYKDKKQYFVDQLARGVGTIAAAFYPKDVIVRMSDFKTNEYAALIGGKEYEPKEDNPMIGWRGASRYYKEGYKDGFILECKAMKKVREEFGLTNVKLMIPFCRTVQEGKNVIAIMKENGLKQGNKETDLQIYVMCEIPSNVILADQFSEIFDGFSIGSNDLTQLTLGVDRDSSLVADVYDERNQAVKDMIASVILKAKKNKRKIGICGQAPSDFPDFAQFLVKEGIDSISLNPDTCLKTRIKIAEEEKRSRR